MGWIWIVVIALFLLGGKAPPVQRAKESAKTGAGTALIILGVLALIALAVGAHK